MKRFSSFALLAIFATASCAQAALINEIRIDDNSTDTDEYFELVGTPGESLDDLYYIVIGDGTGGSGVLERIISLAGMTIPADGFFLAANTGIGTDVPFSNSVDLVLAANTFENSDNVTHLLVRELSGALNDDLDTDNDGTLDVTPWDSIVDAVGFIEGVPGGTEEYFYGASLGFEDVGPDGTFVAGHLYRLPDGGDWNIGPFGVDVVDTPGESNVVIPEPGTAVLAMLSLAAAGAVTMRSRLG